MAAHQEEGWPLGLQPLNVRIGLGRTRDFFGSMSFNTTMLTGSPTSSTDSSSDLDTESTGSFFHDRSITLGSLIGVSSILELSRRSIRGRRAEPLKVKKPCKAKPWIFSLCSRDSIDVKSTTHNTPSLGQFLAVERRAANNDQRRNQSPNDYVPDEISLAQPIPQPNSLFVDGRVAPPQSSSLSGFETESGQSEGNDQGNNNGHGVPVLFSCMCGKDDIN
ncbi:hypothetical protein BVRB_7g174000 isoform A [Beta vulgaris subsp. vulgaris]|uniref:uncharacterized protein At3g17950 isoform X1 n=2 Tax=Beta vulgaris subsp. vulgaris TaxID=3555 RepID=UPI00053F4132|nr:uncharacterized protein At3g17950 isoform X1 [Beta vulgaris subsp. vulgaris]KMT05260.1 hypothetical protein BVRB_7g174000 isoform A [Beta vulgaris subsp. vulgaris]